jgi:hypothetical protein
MQMFDSLIDTLHGRYQGTFLSAAETATCQWHRLMSRLDEITDAIENQGDNTLRIPFISPLAANPQPPQKVRTLRTAESFLLEAVTVDGNAGLLTIMRDGVVIYAKTFAAADTRPGEGVIIQGPGEITVNAVNATNIYMQYKFIRESDQEPRKSRAGEKGIGVDSRENPGAADQGRHSLDAPTMLGHSTLSGT